MMCVCFYSRLAAVIKNHFFFETKTNVENEIIVWDHVKHEDDGKINNVNINLLSVYFCGSVVHHKRLGV